MLLAVIALLLASPAPTVVPKLVVTVERSHGINLDVRIRNASQDGIQIAIEDFIGEYVIELRDAKGRILEEPMALDYGNPPENGWVVLSPGRDLVLPRGLTRADVKHAKTASLKYLRWFIPKRPPRHFDDPDVVAIDSFECGPMRVIDLPDRSTPVTKLTINGGQDQKAGGKPRQTRVGSTAVH